jgi:hypothetical protein
MRPQDQKRSADVIGAAVMVAKIATGEVEEKNRPKKDEEEAANEGETEKFKPYPVDASELSPSGLLLFRMGR